MKYQASIKKRCKSCKFVYRKNRNRVVCAESPKHKQCQK